MATYTAITDAEIDQDSPITQTLMTKYRDNLTAVTEGDASAPSILPNIAAKTASQAIGSYIIAWNTTGTAIAANNTIAGTSLRISTSNTLTPFSIPTAYNSTTFPTSNTTTLSGTWRAINQGGGRYSDGSLNYYWPPSLWLRIS